MNKRFFWWFVVAVILAILFCFICGILEASDPEERSSSMTCEVIGPAYINWWSNTKLQVWWECSKTRRTTQWSCWVQVESPSNKVYDLIWQDQEPELFDDTLLEIRFPFWLEPGIWEAVDGRCWSEGEIFNELVVLYEKDITHNTYPLAQWPFEQLIGGLDSAEESNVYVSIVMK